MVEMFHLQKVLSAGSPAASPVLQAYCGFPGLEAHNADPYHGLLSSLLVRHLVQAYVAVARRASSVTAATVILVDARTTVSDARHQSTFMPASCSEEKRYSPSELSIVRLTYGKIQRAAHRPFISY
jgi:hypothetical protein